MVDSYKNNIGLPVYKQGFNKEFQTYSHIVNVKKNIRLAFSNYILSFGTPKISKGTTIDYVKLYKYSNGWETKLTYSELINYRDSGTLIENLSFITTNLNNSIVFYHSGEDEITQLDSGIYEIELTMSDGSIYESDLFYVDKDNLAPQQLAYILESDGVVMSEDGISPTIWG